MYYSGTARVGAAFNDTLSSFYPTVSSAFREVVDNACAAGASRCDIQLTTAHAVGAYHPGDLPVLVVHTDTFLDVTHSLDIAHGVSNRAYGALNNFGIGSKGFRAKLGTHTQVLIVTFQKGEAGETVVSMGRMGSVMDRQIDHSGDHVGISYARGCIDGAGTVRLEWGGDMNAQNKFLTNLPWFNENSVFHVRATRMADVMVPAMERGDPCGTFFLYYNDQTRQLPFKLDVHGALCVLEDDGVEVPLHTSLVESYIDMERTMPRVTVGSHTVPFELHPWAQAQGGELAPAYDIYVPTANASVATVRYVCVAEDGTPNAHYDAHKRGRDGAYCIVNGRKVVAGRTSVFDGRCFGVAAMTIEEYMMHASRKGTGVLPEQRKSLRTYVTCNVGEVETLFDQFAPQSRFGTWMPRAKGLWPRVGLGTMALIDFNMDIVKMDPTKTSFIFANTGVSANTLLAHLRFHALVWSVCRADGVAFTPPFSTAPTLAAARPMRCDLPLLLYTPNVPLHPQGARRKRHRRSYKTELVDLMEDVLAVLTDKRLANGEKLATIRRMVGGS